MPLNLCSGSDTPTSGNLFGWEKRYNVALGVAEALDYLHNTTEPIVHRDVKSSNILLSDDYEPQVPSIITLLSITAINSISLYYLSRECLFVRQLSDFGLSTWASSCSHHTDISDVAGTFGWVLYSVCNIKSLPSYIITHFFLWQLLSSRVLRAWET